MKHPLFEKVLEKLNDQLLANAGRKYKLKLIAKKINQVEFLYNILEQIKADNHQVSAYYVYEQAKKQPNNPLAETFYQIKPFDRLLIKYAKDNNLYKAKGDVKHCSHKGCMGKRLHHHTRTKRGATVKFGFCNKHEDHNQKMYKKRNKVRHTKAKVRALANADAYYLANYKRISKLNLINRKKVLSMIEEYYKVDALLEPRFAILLCDILRLQGGDPIHEYPYWIEGVSYLCPKFADLVDRKLMFAIETKAAFHGTGSQRNLHTQLIEYKFFFKGYKVIGVSPDSVQPGTISLYALLKIIIKRRIKVLGK